MLRNILFSMLAVLLCLPAMTFGQDEGRIIFTDPKSEDDKVFTEDDLAPRAHAWGGDLMIGVDGFGLGFFYNRTFDDIMTVFANLSLSEAKDSDQRDYYDPYFGQIS
ncbi:MAG: hypothetical protein KFH87_02840, partial [Bacteroidetes bacterium]|nr:hypothetical protein [Bacteroidota bacterium]